MQGIRTCRRSGAKLAAWYWSRLHDGFAFNSLRLQNRFIRIEVRFHENVKEDKRKSKRASVQGAEVEAEPGQSGNPGGRPKKNPITECYRAHLEEPLPHALRISLKLPKGTTWTDALTMAQLLLAIKGNTQAAKEITDRVEGKVAQQVEVANSEDPSPSVLTPEQIYKH